MSLDNEKRKTAGSNERVVLIANDLLNGIPREKIIEKYGKLWDFKKSAIDSIIKEAKEYNIGRTKRIEDQYNKAIDKIAAEQERAILSVIERQIILSDIAEGKVKYQKTISSKDGLVDVWEFPAFSARVAAIKTLNEMDGANAPVKTESKIDAIIWNEVKTYDSNSQTNDSP